MILQTTYTISARTSPYNVSFSLQSTENKCKTRRRKNACRSKQHKCLRLTPWRSIRSVSSCLPSKRHTCFWQCPHPCDVMYEYLIMYGFTLRRFSRKSPVFHTFISRYLDQIPNKSGNEWDITDWNSLTPINKVWIWRIKDQLDVTCYFSSLFMCSTCFGHYPFDARWPL